MILTLYFITEFYFAIKYVMIALVSGGYMKLVIKKLKKSFDNNEVLKDINFEFEEGKIYGLLGRNGAGKTTLFNCLNEDIEIDSGTFYLVEDGKERNISDDDIGYVLSTPLVPEFLTAREFLKFFIDINKDKITSEKAIDEYFDLIKMDVSSRNKLMKEYSMGMKSKMQMLINIIYNPKIMLLDEPLTSFDVVVADEMKKLLKSIKKDHILIFSTHIMELALDLCDEIVVLNNGRLEKMERDSLTKKEFENKIIDTLKGEEDD